MGFVFRYDFVVFFASDCQDALPFGAVTFAGGRESDSLVAHICGAASDGLHPVWVTLTVCCPPGNLSRHAAAPRGTASSVHQVATKPQEKQTGRAGGCVSEASCHSFAQLEPPMKTLIQTAVKGSRGMGKRS